MNYDYSNFYQGTSTINSYGNGAYKKDTLVKYEFKTTDEHGNKIMDKMSKEELMKAMKDISSQYGDNVIVEFSGDGLAALSESIKEQSRKQGCGMTEEEKALWEQKCAELDKHIVHLENTHRLIIPNIQTNEKLYKSLENADENVVKASMDIIRNHLLPHNIAGMSEDERKEMIAFGLEESKYLAENYLDKEHGKEYLAAMETIAKYGMNGTVSPNGQVTYHIEKGPLVGAPDEYVHESDILKEKAPDLYRQMRDLNTRIINGESGWGSRFIELQKQINQVLNRESDTLESKTGKRLTNYEEAAARYKSWKETMEKTELPDVYQRVSYKNVQAFFESLKKQAGLSEVWVNNSANRFMAWFGI